MRRLAVRLSYIAVPLIAICAFLFVQQQMDGLAPAPPAAIPGPIEVESPKTTQPAEPRPTVLAPDDATLPSASVGTPSPWPNAAVTQTNISEPSDFTPPFDRSDLELNRSRIGESPNGRQRPPFSTARGTEPEFTGDDFPIR